MQVNLLTIFLFGLIFEYISTNIYEIIFLSCNILAICFQVESQANKILSKGVKKHKQQNVWQKDNLKNDIAAAMYSEKIRYYESLLECSFCSKIFANKSNLRKHYKIHTEDRSYACEICDKTFVAKLSLLNHLKQHTGERPFECDICGKTFVETQTFRRHYKVHMIERPYECDVCGKTFAATFNLRSHYRMHTGERPYKCSICEASFKDSSNFRRHTKRKHNILF